MDHLKFCPQCGQQSLQWQPPKQWQCPACDYLYFHNPAAAVALIIRHEDQILLTRRNQQPGLGLLDLAGGFVDPNESAEQTCCREIQEELGIGLQIEKLKFLASRPNTYPYRGILYRTLDLFFEYEMTEKPSMTIETSELQEVIWLPIDQLKPEDFAFDSFKNFFQDYRK
jgi:NAD+ diphosphatase